MDDPKAIFSTGFGKSCSATEFMQDTVKVGPCSVCRWLLYLSHRGLSRCRGCHQVCGGKFGRLPILQVWLLG